MFMTVSFKGSARCPPMQGTASRLCDSVQGVALDESCPFDVSVSGAG